MLPSAARLVLLAIVSSMFGACGSTVIGPAGSSVGAQCTASSQCSSYCVTGERHYPGGMCTVKCTSDAQCPSGTACVDDDDGLCAVSCGGNGDCSGFGRGFVCDDEDRVGATGKASVCRVP